jgi:hypothetical protein
MTKVAVMKRRSIRIDEVAILHYCSAGCRRVIEEEVVKLMMMIARLLLMLGRVEHVVLDLS